MYTVMDIRRVVLAGGFATLDEAMRWCNGMWPGCAARMVCNVGISVFDVGDRHIAMIRRELPPLTHVVQEMFNASR